MCAICCILCVDDGCELNRVLEKVPAEVLRERLTAQVDAAVHGQVHRDLLHRHVRELVNRVHRLLRLLIALLGQVRAEARARPCRILWCAHPLLIVWPRHVVLVEVAAK